jgi:hypothetical protein
MAPEITRLTKGTTTEMAILAPVLKLGDDEEAATGLDGSSLFVVVFVVAGTHVSDPMQV